MAKLVLCILRYPSGLLGHLKLKINNEFSLEGKSIDYGGILGILQQVGMITCWREGQVFQEWQ